MCITTTRSTPRLTGYRHGAGFLLARLGARAERGWAEHLRAASLSQTEFALLTALLDADEPLRQADVAVRAGIDPRNAVGVVARLRERGLVEAVIDPADRRAKQLGLTDEGRAVLADLDVRLAPARAEFFAALSDDEYDQLCGLLVRLHGTPPSRSRPISP